MVIIMDMETGKRLNEAEVVVATEFGPFADEVLNAGWLPQPAARLETQATFERFVAVEDNAEEFLHNLYRHQE